LELEGLVHGFCTQLRLALSIVFLAHDLSFFGYECKIRTSLCKSRAHLQTFFTESQIIGADESVHSPW
jgi:hypothetical protein